MVSEVSVLGHLAQYKKPHSLSLVIREIQMNKKPGTPNTNDNME
jgi:hypothetical protein